MWFYSHKAMFKAPPQLWGNSEVANHISSPHRFLINYSRWENLDELKSLSDHTRSEWERYNLEETRLLPWIKREAVYFLGRSPLYNHTVKLGVKKRNSAFLKHCFKHIPENSIIFCQILMRLGNKNEPRLWFTACWFEFVPWLHICPGD